MTRLKNVLSLLVVLVLPFFLLMTSIRIMFTPLFLQIEYNRPGFPPDAFGFTTAERLEFGRQSMKYLFNRSDDDSLANLQMADGSPLYNEREVSHMLDVKILLQKMILAWVILGIFLLLAGSWAWRGGWLRKFWQSLQRGGWLTIGLIAAILIAVALSFNWLFTNFHLIFFSGDTWLFAYSDSLIRLFPLELWQDAFIGMGVITVLLAGLLIWLGGRFSLKS